jgi:hypothetical protein
MATATLKINTLRMGPINLKSMTATGLLVLLIDYKSYRSVPPPPVLRGGSDLHPVLTYEEEGVLAPNSFGVASLTADRPDICSGQNFS